MSGETTFVRGRLTVSVSWNTPSEEAAARFAQVWVDKFERPHHGRMTTTETERTIGAAVKVVR